MTQLALLHRADEIRITVSDAVAGEGYPDDGRTTLLLAYTSIALEHHDAITRLIRGDLCGSAFALVRVVFETLYRALWLQGCASPDDVAKIFDGAPRVFPHMDDLADAVDNAYGANGFFGIVKQRGWTAMNEYTHSGLLQISRRFRGRNVAPNYQEGDIQDAVRNTTVFIAMLGILLARTANRDAEATVIETVLTDFARDTAPETPATP